MPLVSLCTPTFNRRPFIPFMIKCFSQQLYPKNRIEWIIIDDGTDPIKDLVKDIPQVKYYYYEDKMELGKKRNLMHSKCSGDIIVYMDDDDYYPPERISHAVDMLQQNPKFLIAGSSEMHIYFDSKKHIYKCGPYAPYHATAATFAFKKELLTQTHYDESKSFAEEKVFTKNYTIPLLQLNTLKTILVFSHQHNSLNKERLLQNPKLSKVILSQYEVSDFIKNPILKQFYMEDINNVLEQYEAGKIENKPILLKELKIKEMTDKLKIKGNNTRYFNNMDEMRDYYEKQLADKTLLINKLLLKVKELS